MAQDIDVHLDDHLERFVQQQLAERRFGSVREVFEAALLLLEEREARLAKLRAAFQQGEQEHLKHAG